jgi:hypothetical protein
MTDLQNAVAICVGNMENAFKQLGSSTAICVQSWSANIIAHIERLFASLQTKSDFAPKPKSKEKEKDKSDPGDQNNAPGEFRGQHTAACDAICKLLVQITGTIINYEQYPAERLRSNNTAISL